MTTTDNIESLHKAYNIFELKEDIVISFIDEENVYADKAKEFHNLLLNGVIKNSIKDKGEVFGCLSSIKIRSGCKIRLRLAGYSETGYSSYFYIYDGQNKEDTNLARYITVDNSAMGAWQFYLLMKASTIMPFYRQGRFKNRIYIYSKTDVQKIEVFKRLDISGLLAKDFLLPTVRFVKVEEDCKDETLMFGSATKGTHGKYEADVYCCYWNEWKGLVREHIKMIINDSNVESFEVVGNFIIYPYDCGIY